MPRKINDKLIDRMTGGDLSAFLQYVKDNEEQLRLEVRRAGKAFIYYNKCKILELGLRSYHIDGKYFEDKKEPKNIKKTVLSNPAKYFSDIIPVVDNWLVKHPKREFETQQNIARNNQREDCRYLILDMEYNFSQENILPENRVKKAGFDLLGIERASGQIVLFEVKKGLKALTGKSGIKDHIIDYEECLYGRNKSIFKGDLIIDVQNIIRDKTKLGLINISEKQNMNFTDETKFMFIFEPDKCTRREYETIFERQSRASKSTKKYQTIFVSKNNYKLA